MNAVIGLAKHWIFDNVTLIRKRYIDADFRLRNMLIIGHDTNASRFLCSMTPKTMSQIFPVKVQSLLKPHYVYTAWLHKISSTLIVCWICSINSIRNPRHGFADNKSKNSIHQNQASRGTNAGANFIQSRHFMSKIVVEKFLLVPHFHE